jgi:polysaccharide deacetylase family protein (PEP-CTERM system associated)
MIMNALTVDVEEYYHAAIFQKATRCLTGRTFESRVVGSMEQLLLLFERHQSKGTFFVLGEVARAHPALVRRIAGEQHEVGCHGDRHIDVCRQRPGDFRADVRQAKADIEQIIGQEVIGYRAPNFSIGLEEAWAYEVLAEEGYQYDSSLHPIHHDRYGQPNAPRFPYEIWGNGVTRLTEFPIGTARMLGVNMPIGGGGFFRLLPFSLIRLGMRRVNLREQQPFMFYLHPWELDPGQPRPPMSWPHRFRHYVGVEREADKLARLMALFRFGTVRDILQIHPVAPPSRAVPAPAVAAPPLSAELGTR